MFELPLLNIFRGGRQPAGGLEVREVRTGRDLDRSLDLPRQIYADDPCWVPPLRVEVKEFLDRRKHPFFRKTDRLTTQPRAIPTGNSNKPCQQSGKS